jgi:hypothetical protein
MDDTKEKNDEELKWTEARLKNPVENIIPVLKATILLLQEEKKATEKKIEEFKKLRELNKHGK